MKPGDIAEVTGDSANWEHMFDPGTAVELVRPSNNTWDDPRPDVAAGWLAKECGTSGHRTTWSVHKDDLRLLESAAVRAWEPKAGDSVIVTGDSANLKHKFSPGTKATVLRSQMHDDGHFRCFGPDGQAWWVAVVDLKPLKPLKGCGNDRCPCGAS